MQEKNRIPKKVKKDLYKRFEILSKGGTKEAVPWIEYIYETIDIIYKHQVKPLAVCKKGCSYCCHVPVEVTSVEASYIGAKTGITPNDLKNIELIAPDNSPCPFLKDRVCSIYKYRPVACRTFATIDSVNYCQSGGNSEHQIINVRSNDAMSWLYSLIIDASHNEKRFAPYADIRKWFSDEVQI